MQFGHAGACANAEAETAVSKNKALAEAGAHVPRSFDELGDLIRYGIVRFYMQVTSTFSGLVLKTVELI